MSGFGNSIDSVRNIQKPFYVVVDGSNGPKKLFKDVIQAVQERESIRQKLTMKGKSYPVRLLLVEESKTGFAD